MIHDICCFGVEFGIIYIYTCIRVYVFSIYADYADLIMDSYGF